MKPLFAAVLIGTIGAAGCGGAVGEARPNSSEGGDAGAQGSAGAGGSGGLSSATDGGMTAVGGSATGGVTATYVTSTYVDPACPTTPPPTVYSECDPLGDSSECNVGYGCYPITEYPDEPCESETFQMLCLPTGTGQQWDSCSGLNDCAKGYICVVTGQGTECLRMCDPERISSCPSGLFCDAVDLQGIGICY